MWNRSAPTLLVLLTAVLVMIVSASCDERANVHIAKTERPKILLLLNVNSNEFFRKIEEGFRQGMSPEMRRDYQLDVRYCVKPADVGYQRNVLEHYFADCVEGQKDPSLKAVVMTPAGSGDEVTAQIKQLRDKNIPVVLVDLRIQPAALSRAHTDYSAYIGSQNRDGAILAADEMARCLPEGGSILVLNGVPSMQVAKERRAGFIDRLAEIGKEGQTPYKITEKSADFLRAQAQSTVTELLTMGQSYEGIFAANDEMALGALEALRLKHNQSKVVIIGFDAIEEATKAVKDGGLAATIAQDPAGMGQRAAQTVEKLFQNKPVEKEQILPPKAITN
jgi:ribose transport system substrate-binding protein